MVKGLFENQGLIFILASSFLAHTSSFSKTMYRIVQGSSKNLADVTAFIELLNDLARHPVAAARQLFDLQSELWVTRAPGRLDVMGGIADYSGSLVLQLPIQEAALVALQKDDKRQLSILSLNAEKTQRTNFFKMPLADFEHDGEPFSYAEARAHFRLDEAENWAAYVAGAFLVLMREKGFRFKQGARILIDSKVPEGKGVSSSAAIEVAVMSAVLAAFELALAPRELALLCQKVENEVVGAPCGVMDQMASACGQENQLLALLCQPAELQAMRRIPEGLAFWGIDSGIRHSVGAGDYGSVRTGAFMGYRIIAELAGCKIAEAQTAGSVCIDDADWHGYLANVTPAKFAKDYAAHLPEHISGAEFLRRYKGITDRVTRVQAEKNYPVLQPTAHPIYEHARVCRFAELLQEPIDEGQLQELGELMYGSHASYSACGLGSEGTDLLVQMVCKAGREEGLYGAKITGGGSGGTVAVLGRRGADATIAQIASAYAEGTGYQPRIFSGSSQGAAAFGYLRLQSAE
jgi:L-arabinokinase